MSTNAQAGGRSEPRRNPNPGGAASALLDEPRDFEQSDTRRRFDELYPDQIRRVLDLHHRGLSNTAYLAASPERVRFQVSASPARVKFKLSDDANRNSMTPSRGGGARGCIRELSESARDRLADRAWTLQAEGQAPEVMLTLTAPANWRSLYVVHEDTGEVIEGGREFKRHLDAFRKRLDRWFQKQAVFSWSVLWFLEFQGRGAPHVHLLIFGCKIDSTLRGRLRSWCGRNWARSCGNPDPDELAKHIRAGSQVAKMRQKHFGYAVKYARKTEQKIVPDEFRSVGRFWGIWNYKPGAPVVLDFDLDFTRGEHGTVYDLAFGALSTVHEHAPKFAATWAQRLERLVTDLGIKRAFSFTVFGSAASAAVLDLASI